MVLPGGAERVIGRLADLWAREGRRVAVVTFDLPDAPWFYGQNRTVERLRIGGLGESRGILDAVRGNWMRTRALRRAIREWSPQVVVSFGDTTNVLAVIAALGLAPVVISERTMPSVAPLRGRWRVLRSLLYPFADGIVVQSRAAAAYFCRFARRKVAIIANPVPPPLVVRDPARAEGRTIAAAGRFTWEKGFDVLIDAFAASDALRSGWSLAIYGDGPLRPELEERVRARGLEERIRLPGITTDLPRDLAQADLFVLSSVYDGFPNVLCEAMAAGLPVVATACPGAVTEIVRPSVDGILVPVRDAAAMARAIDALARDPQERRRLGRNALQITERFSVDAVLKEWDRLLKAAGGLNS